MSDRRHRRAGLATMALLAVITASCADGAPEQTPAPAAAGETTTVPVPTGDPKATVEAPTATAAAPAAPTAPAVRGGGGGTIHGLGDAGATLRADTPGFDVGTTLTWTASNIRLRTSTRPIVAGEVTFLALDDRIVAVGNSDGRQRWAIRYNAAGEAPLGDLVVDGDRLVYLRVDGVIAIVDTAGGKVTATVRTVPAASGSRTAPVVVDGKLYSAATGALDVIDLQRATATSVPLQASVATGGRLAISGGTGIVASADPAGRAAGKVVAFDLTSGRTLWEQTAANTGWAVDDLLVADGTVLTTAFNRPADPTRSSALTAWDLTTGRVLWENPDLVGLDGGPITRTLGAGPLAASSGVLVVPVTLGFSGLDLRSGRQLWAAEPNEYVSLNFGFRDVSDLLVTAGGSGWLLVHPPQEGAFRIVGIDLRTGTKIAETSTGPRSPKRSSTRSKQDDVVRP